MLDIENMIEEIGDFWNIEGNFRCITTNGALRKSGNAIMGKGIALQAKLRYSDLEKILGKYIREKGIHVYYLGHNLIAFPTKWHWREKSDINLIKRSAIELVNLVDKLTPNARVLLTRPGCGNGELKWVYVKPIIEQILKDNRFVIISDKDII